MFYDNTGYSLLHEQNLWTRARTPVQVNVTYIQCTYCYVYMMQQRIAYSYINKFMNEAIIFTGDKLSWRSNVNGRV